MSSFLDKYRKNKSELMKKVLDKLETEGKAYGEADGRFWKLSRDKQEKGNAIIRFLPDVNSGEDWVKVVNYAFQGPTGQWYIENSLRTIGKEDPVNDANRKLYATGNKDDEAIAKSRGAKTVYISNILVVKDPLNPDNEGKVFLFKYGKGIFEFIKGAIKPKFEEDEQFFPFDPIEGRNFSLRIFKSEKNNQYTYESSKFMKESAIAEDDDAIEEILNKTYDITEFIGEDKFKSYAELAKRFALVWDEDAGDANSFNDEEIDDEITDDEKEETSVPKEKVNQKQVEMSSDEDDEDIDFFK